MRKKVFICSPFRGDMEGNARKAAAYSRMAVEEGYLPIAPHLLFPQFLNEGIEEERQLGIAMGMELLKMKKDEVVYVYNGGTSGANGGGSGNSYASGKQYGARGGGCTHVATLSGVLGYSNNSGLNYANRSNVLIVAGGGGGGGIENGTVHKGGDGGGERGGNGSDGALGGRQISTGSSPSTNFGVAPSYSYSNVAESGGGSGWFAGNYGIRGQSGAGGSGYIDGVAPFTHNGKYYPAETETGVNKGNGKAFIRYIECA